MIWCLKLGGRAPRPDREPYTRRAMADKVDKPKKKAKSKKDDKGVLAALPTTRPERIGNRRTEPAARRPRAKPASNGAETAPAAAKATKSTRAKTASRASSSRATTARPKAAAPHTFEPTQAAETAAKAAAPPTSRPRPVSEGAPGIGTGGTAPGERPPESARPSGIELAGTAVKAAGEVAQLGITIGGHLLKRALDRLPRP
jgi:hypothetical protein